MKGLIFFVVYTSFVVASNLVKNNNVCSRLLDYSTKEFNSNCWYNPDADLRVPEIIKRYGYPLETHNVTTNDGYILQMFRIPYGRKSSRNEKTRQPVFLQHGIVSSCAVWVITGNNSLGFLLADNGYDVWLGNSRGNSYGKGHINLSINDERFWNFSQHEMGTRDLPSSFDYIYEITNRKDIIFIGQSMGGNLALLYASEMTEHANERLKLIVSLAPGVFLSHTRTPARVLAPFWQILEKTLRRIKFYEIFPETAAIKQLTSSLCLQSEAQILFCETGAFVIFGFDYHNLPPEMLPLILGHYPAGTSLRTFIHLFQTVTSGRFAHYDYGRTLNKEYYGSEYPPDYNLSKITLPNYIMYSDNDWIATEQDIMILRDRLTNSEVRLQKSSDKKYNHIDWFFAKDVFSIIYEDLLKVINNYKT